MGVPSATLTQNLTDRMAAILKLDLAGRDTELASATNLSMWNQVDASVDPSVLSALSSVCDAVDKQSLPANYSTSFQTIASRVALVNFVQALNTLYVQQSGSATLQLGLLAQSATLHPLFAELCRSALGQAILDSAATPGTVTEVFAPNYQVRSADRVYTGADGSLVDDTTDAGSSGTADVALFATNGFNCYIGSRYQFTQVIFGLSTLASATYTPTFKYWNGNAWATLTVTDNSAGLIKNDTITFTAPTDWAPYYKDQGGTAFPSEDTPLYYIAITRTNGTLVTPPVGTCIKIVPAAVLLGSTQHFGVDQPPLGIIRITGASALTVTAPVNLDYTRFKPGAVRLRALTPGLGTPTLTISYLNQAGSAQTQAQSALSSPAALATVNLTLNGADTGLRSVSTTGWVVSGGAQGVLSVEHVEDRVPAL